MSRSAPKPFRNSLRPMIVTNSIIAGAVIAGIGIAYAWLGWKKSKRADQMVMIDEAISRLDLQIKSKESAMSEQLADARLRQRVQNANLGLQDIGKGEGLVTVRGTTAEDFHLVKNDEK